MRPRLVTSLMVRRLAAILLLTTVLAAPLLSVPGVPKWAVGGGWVLAVAVFTGLSWTWSPRGPRLRPQAAPAKGGVEWEPAGTPRPHPSVRIDHSWMNAEKGRRFVATLSFEMPDGVPPAVLKAATRKGLAAATRALPSRGKVKATGDFEDLRGPTSRAIVRLETWGFGLDGPGSGAAAEAFGEAFVVHLRKAGFEARRGPAR